MPYTITALTPVAQGSAYINPDYVAANLRTPSVTGSVADNLDATFTELRAEYPVGETTARFSDVITCDFVWGGAEVPLYMVMQIRAKSAAEYAANPLGVNNRNIDLHTRYLYASDPSATPFDSWTIGQSSNDPNPLNSLSMGQVATPQWFTFYFGSDPVDPTTVDPSNWLDINPDTAGVAGWQVGDALVNGGMRFALYGFVTSNGDPDAAFLDLYEVRMLVAYLTTAPPSVSVRTNPSLRMLQRGGQGGMSGIPRMIGDPTRRGSVRQGPGSVY